MASTKFHFDFSKGHRYKLEGDAHCIDHSLRFTKTDDHDYPLQWSMGRAIYKSVPAVYFKANFEIEVQFKVTPMENTPYGDGLAFFIVPGGYKYPTFGIVGSPGVFAVVFDTDSQNPIKFGICFSEKTPNSWVPLPADSFLNTNLELKVSYDSAIKCISASISNGNMTFSVSCTYDLSDFFPPMVEVGLGSSTSEYVAVHDVFSWHIKKGTAPQATS